METSTRRAARSEATVLETFLSGMETILRGHFPAYPSPPLKPSLVEWKLIGGPYIRNWERTLKPSLVEWKPRGAHQGRGQDQPLETFLSGMET